MNKTLLKRIIKEELLREAYYGSVPGEPETPEGYGGALDAAKVQKHLGDEIDDLVRLGKMDINDLSIETVRANQEIPWDKFQAIDDEVLGDIIRDYQRRQKFYKEGNRRSVSDKNILEKIIREELQRECGMAPSPSPITVDAPLSGGIPLPSQGSMAMGSEMNVSDEELAGMNPSDAFNLAWTSAAEQLRAEFPEAAARLESLTLPSGPSPEEIGGS